MIDQTIELIDKLRALLGVLEVLAPKPTVSESVGSKFESLYQEGEIPPYERNLNNDLCNLGERWREHVRTHDAFRDSAAMFNMDGFYPYYTCQKCKILFVGREACWLEGGNYIETVCRSIQTDNFNGWKVNQYPFHKRQFYIAYGILKFVTEGVFPKWEDVPWPSDMAKAIFAKSGINSEQHGSVGGLRSISWAFINLSKLSNNTGDWQIGDTYYSFINDAKNREYTRKEIRLLAPDIIVGANVPELAEILGYTSPDKTNANCHYYTPQGGFPHFLNCWHFSAIKSDKIAFYDPVAEVVQKHCGELHKREIHL